MGLHFISVIGSMDKTCYAIHLWQHVMLNVTTHTHKVVLWIWMNIYSPCIFRQSLRNRKPLLWLLLSASLAARVSRSVGFIRSRRRREVARFSVPQWREEQPITAAVTSRHSANQRPRCRHSGPGRECRRGTWNRSPGCQMLYVHIIQRNISF